VVLVFAASRTTYTVVAFVAFWYVLYLVCVVYVFSPEGVKLVGVGSFCAFIDHQNLSGWLFTTTLVLPSLPEGRKEQRTEHISYQISYQWRK